MIKLGDFIKALSGVSQMTDAQPWQFVNNIERYVRGSIQIEINKDDFTITDNVAIHKDAIVEPGAVIKGPALIYENCFVAAGAYLRGGVFLGINVTIGPGVEIKRSMIFPYSNIAHFNFIGDSIIGSHVNFEAGAIIANHYNERADKRIYVFYDSKLTDTGCEKFGALVGDSCKIGANAVLSPGTILPPKSIVRRLELVDQCC